MEGVEISPPSLIMTQQLEIRTPDVTSICSDIEVLYTGADFTVSLSSHLRIEMGMMVVRRELAQLAKKDSTINLERLSEMWSSSDLEMRQLLLDILVTKTKYSGMILRSILFKNITTLDDVLQLYRNNNRYNLTEEIW